VLERWTPESRRGAWVELAGVRFIGAGYLGAATPHKVRQIVDRLEPGRPQVLLLHAGPDYFVGESGGFSADDLELIRQKVSYLALGHIHKPMLHEGWACNPGSPENCDLNESLHDRDKDGAPRSRGYAWVEIDPSSEKTRARIEIRSNPRRPVFHLNLDCTPLSGGLNEGTAALERTACGLIAENAVPANAVVAMRLAGKANFGRLAFDLEAVARNIETAANVTAVALDLSATELEGLSSTGGNVETTFSREEIERSAIRGLVEEERLRGLDGEREIVANLFFELKEAVRANKSVEELAELVNVSPLIETMRAAAAVPVETVAGPANPGELPLLTQAEGPS
jgi:DNA repair exonuclease SbcCD nuclease subunit